MADEDNLEGVLLSQDEMDKILCDVKTESQKNEAAEPEVGLSQNELDALFAAPRDPAMQAPAKVERKKSISIVVGRAKWTEKEINNFISGQPVVLDKLINDSVEVLADGHCIARAVLGELGGRLSILCVTPVADTEK